MSLRDEVLVVLRAAQPGTLSAGRVMSRLPEQEGFVLRVNVLETLKELEAEGLVERVSDESDTPAEWRAK